MEATKCPICGEMFYVADSYAAHLEDCSQKLIRSVRQTSAREKDRNALEALYTHACKIVEEFESTSKELERLSKDYVKMYGEDAVEDLPLKWFVTYSDKENVSFEITLSVDDEDEE